MCVVCLYDVFRLCARMHACALDESGIVCGGAYCSINMHARHLGSGLVMNSLEPKNKTHAVGQRETTLRGGQRALSNT